MDQQTNKLNLQQLNKPPPLSKQYNILLTEKYIQGYMQEMLPFIMLK